MTDIDHGPTPDDVLAHAVMELTPKQKLDRFERTILTLPPNLWDGSLVLAEDYEDVLIDGVGGAERCFVGHAIVQAPEALGIAPHEVVDAMTLNEEESWTARAYGIPRALVHHIFIGVSGLRFDDAVRFAKDCIALAKRHAGEVLYDDYPAPEAYDTSGDDE